MGRDHHGVIRRSSGKRDRPRQNAEKKVCADVEASHPARHDVMRFLRGSCSSAPLLCVTDREANESEDVLVLSRRVGCMPRMLGNILASASALLFASSARCICAPRRSQ